MTNITVKIDDDKKEAYKKLCKSRDTTISQELRKFISRELEANKK